MTILQVMNDAIIYDQPRLAYSIFWALQNGKVSENQSFEDFQRVELDMAAIEIMMKGNVLGVSNIKLYSSKIANGLFHLVLANNEQEARGEVLREVGIVPGKLADITRGMDNLLWFEDQQTAKTIRQIKDEAVRIPHYIGIYDITEKTYEQVEYEYFQKFGKKFEEGLRASSKT